MHTNELIIASKHYLYVVVDVLIKPSGKYEYEWISCSLRTLLACYRHIHVIDNRIVVPPEHVCLHTLVTSP